MVNLEINDPIIQKYIETLVGKKGYAIIEKIPDKELTDEKIAEVTDSNLSLVRKTLFTLYENRLATYRRERDDSSGWLTYYWRIDLSKTDQLLKHEAKKLLKNLQQRLAFEQDNMFYICPDHNIRFIFEDATENDFKCPECGIKLQYLENEELINAIKKRIEELKMAI